MHVHQLLRHLFYLGDEVGEELCHVFLLAGVKRLFVHCVGFTKWPGVVCFSLTLLKTHRLTQIIHHTKPSDFTVCGAQKTSPIVLIFRNYKGVKSYTLLVTVVLNKYD